ncbi:hypothetical protein MKW94_016521 [Papaver nudicaule]|uniref:Uncharacterized protein n=1 Tax=Papaver nudicaule TaxID=74823 RepID=A0AA41V6L2_PAPNU|nr:hypothetical protein [Papaver nudicaule]
MAASSGKRCYYEILGLNRDCSPEEIRSSYRKLALQRHPDKLISQAGISEKEANAAFQELLNAYEVLSDPKERSWYDSHRNKILFSQPKSSGSSSCSPVPDLFSYYSNSCYSGFGHTGKGFYKVYGDLFDKIYEQEVAAAKKLGLGLDFVREAPLMGNLNCDYTQVTAFYNYWSGFSSCMEFWWADEHDVELGYDRKSRRLYEEQNKKSRKKAKKEYNETVRGLAEFVKKRDKRVVEMKMKKALEEEKKKEELKEKKKELERQKLERARLYEEPDWAKVEEEDIGFEEVVDNDKKKDEIKELYCVICNKKFKSDKQWKNHEQSKKHKEKVAMFKEELGSDDQSEEEVEEILNEVNEDKGPSVSANDAVVDDLSEKFEDAFEFQEEETEEVKKSSIEEEEDEVEDEEEEDEIDVSDVNHDNEAGNSGSDEESILLKAMLSRQKNKKKAASKRETEMPPSSETPDTTTTDDGVSDFMVYDNVKKSARGNRRAKKDNGKKSNGVSQRSEMNEVTEEGNELDNSNAMGSSSDTIDEVGQKSRADPPPSGKNVKGHKKAVDKRGSGAEDMVSNSKKASKGRKQKGSSKSTDHLCDTCGQDFESRNKLHRHLGDTGHASLKSR